MNHKESQEVTPHQEPLQVQEEVSIVHQEPPTQIIYTQPQRNLLLH